MVITLPPLRERSEDVAILAGRFLDELPGRMRLCLSDAALKALRAYRWPGNVRELRNVVSRAVIVARGSTIEVDDLPDDVRTVVTDYTPVGVGQARSSERDRILAVLGECEGNVAEAARRLGISRMTLYRKIRKWSLSRLEVLKAADSQDP
jgi:transcriptional regulator of acetoin/glycerol metabolism